MKITYDVQTDILTIQLRKILVAESNEINSGAILDYDKDGNFIGLEILNASQRVDNPKSVKFSVMD
jgi:uncharacterized protein YuzE